MKALACHIIKIFFWFVWEKMNYALEEKIDKKVDDWVLACRNMELARVKCRLIRL